MLTTWSQVQEAPRQRLRYLKNPSIGVGIDTGAYFTLFDITGDPTGAPLAVGNTINGEIPDSTVSGFPKIYPFGVGAIGYLSRVEFGHGSSSSNVMGRLFIYDILWYAGAYNFNDSISLSSQPDFSARVPLDGLGSVDYRGLELWFQSVTTFTGNLTLAVTYTNQDGVSGHTTGATALDPTIVFPQKRMIQLPLQSGDTGVQKVESVTATVASGGTFNILVVRPLLKMRLLNPNDTWFIGADGTGLIQVFASSAIQVAEAVDLNSVFAYDIIMEIVNG